MLKYVLKGGCQTYPLLLVINDFFLGKIQDIHLYTKIKLGCMISMTNSSVYLWMVILVSSGSFISPIRHHGLFDCYPTFRDYNLSGEKLFKRYCRSCHGVKGDAGRREAANLRESALTKEQIGIKIKNGGKVMPAFVNRISPQGIDSIAVYVLSLRKP